MARRSLFGWVVALAFLCSACGVDATVTVKVREDGSGTVQVDVVADAEAVQTAEVGGGKLEDRVRLSDLPSAGWEVEPWERREDGSAALHLSKSFTSVDEIPGILEELDGPDGPLREASFARTRSFFSTEFTADAVLDLGAIGTGIAADTELAARLQAQGVDPNAVDQQLLGQLREALTVRLVVDLPGPGKTTIEPEPGSSAELASSVTVKDTDRLTLVVVAGVLLVAAMVVAVWPRRRGRRGRRHVADRDRGDERGARPDRGTRAARRTRRAVSSGPGAPPTRPGSRPAS